MHHQRISKQYREQIQHHDSGYLQQNPQKRQVPLSASKNKQQLNYNVQQEYLQSKYNGGAQMTPVGNHQSIKSTYHQNAHFLNQISSKDRANGAPGPPQSVFGAGSSHQNLGQGDRNNQKVLLVNGAPFQQMMTLKASSKLQLHENGSNLIPIEPQQDHQHQMANAMNLKRVNQSSNSQQYIYNQNHGQQHPKTLQMDPRDQRNQQRNNSSNEYKNYRQRIMQSEKKGEFSGQGMSQGVKLENNRTSFPQQQGVKMPQYFSNLKIQGFQNQAIAQNQGVQTPQGQQMVPMLAQIGPKGQITLIQPQNLNQKMQQQQLLQQLHKQQQMQLMLSNNQIPNSQKEQRHPNHLFSNHLIQSKAASTEPQSQQQMRNSQKLVEAAEQLFIQKQLQAQMIQNNQQLGAPHVQQIQSAQKRQSQKNQVQEYRQLQTYQQAFTNAVAHVHDSDQINEDKPKISSLQQHPTPVRSLNARDQLSESRLRTNPEPKDYSEFQEYLQQQQQMQQTECSALQYAHSKKQRELLKAKEYSQNVQLANEAQQMDAVDYSVNEQPTNQILEPQQLQQSDDAQETTPRELLGSKKSQRQAHQLYTPNQSHPHARSQSGNRDRNIENMTILSQPHSELTHQQLIQLQAPQMNAKDVSRSNTNPLNDEKNWGSNKGQSTTTATTGGFQAPSAPRAGSIESKASKNSDAVDSDIEKVEEQQLSKVSEESFMENMEDGGGCDGGCGSEGGAEVVDGDMDGDDDDQEPDYGEEDDGQEEKKAAPQKAKVQVKPKNQEQEEEVKAEKKPSVPRAPWRAKKEEKEKEKADATKAAQPKKKVNKLLGSMPQNWEEEETKFFENDDYNPQFTYDSPATNKKFLKMFPAPKYEYLPQAKKIIDKFLEVYGSESNYFESEGRVLEGKEEVEQIIWDYLDELGPDVRAVGRINFSTKNVASTSVTYDNWTSKIRINVQLPIQYREGRIRGVLHHEIGSHYLRRFNEVQQPWHNERKKYGIKSSIMIEEGSGCINMFLEQSKNPKKWCFLFKPALNYYMCCKASELSFRELFDDLEKYVDNPRQRYKYVLRVKRGLTDTSEPGGLYKDQVYLEGALKLLENRHDVDWHGFYSAKFNIEDLKRPRLMKKLKKENIVLPKFVIDQEDYKKRLDVIAKHNFID